jgi:hypothetical protein
LITETSVPSSWISRAMIWKNRLVALSDSRASSPNL